MARLPFPDNPQRAGLSSDRRVAQQAKVLAHSRRYTGGPAFCDRLVSQQLMRIPVPMRHRPQVAAPLGLAAADQAAMARSRRGGL